MENQIRQLTATIANPLLDRRTKYGVESIKEFVEGSRFVVRLNRDGSQSVELLGRDTYGTSSVGIFSHYSELVNSLILNSVPVEAENFAEIVADVYGSHLVISEEVLNKLIKAGQVNIADVRAAVEEVLDEDA